MMVAKLGSTMQALLPGVVLSLFVAAARRLYHRLRDGLPASAVPLAFSSCRVHRIRSQTGHDYKLLVSLPLRYSAADKSYPVLIVLDAEPYLFPLLTVCARTNHFFAKSYYFPDAIVVGVVADLEAESRFHCRNGGVDVPLIWASQRPTRARDYLPTAAESPWGAPGSGSLLHISGHADEFCDFLADTLVPYVDATYSTRGARARALIGKSFGGSGVGAALIHPRASRLFSEFVLGSPSLAWDDGAWFRLFEMTLDAGAATDAELTAAAYGSPPFAADVFVCLGGEKDVDPEVMARFKRALDSRPGPRGEVCVEIVPGESHGSVSYPFVHHALEWLKPRWQRTE